MGFFYAKRFDPDIPVPYYVVRYSEILTKGQNRIRFERQLIENIRQAWSRRGLRARRLSGRLVLDDPELPEGVAETILGRLPGISNFAHASQVELTIEAIRDEAVRLSADCGQSSFCIRTRRSNKKFPLDSMAVNRVVGQAVADATGMPVSLDHAEHTVHIELTTDEAFISTRRMPGTGGLPVGTSGTVIALLSGGLDSPVAAYKLIRRGCRVVLVHFHNYTRDQGRVRDKLVDLARVLARHQHVSTLYLIPFDQVQAAIITAVPSPQRMVTYRRVMMQMATAVLEREKGQAFVTGDSVGQVASQTLTNLAAIHEAASHPILSPLIGDDKDETVALARRIGTYDISIRPYEDCCSFLIARHPDTRVKLSYLRHKESGIPQNDLTTEAIQEAEVLQLEADDALVPVPSGPSPTEPRCYPRLTTRAQAD